MEMYDVSTISLESFRRMISEGDDSYNNQIRIRNDGMVFLSQGITGLKNLDDIAFRFETFNAGNGYATQEFSESEDVEIMYTIMKRNWELGCPYKYIDDFSIISSM